jgi:Fe2+ transport system protein FeoA
MLAAPSLLSSAAETPARVRTPLSVPLTTVPVGAVATLQDVQAHESRPLLRALGLTNACRLRICKIGDPCIVQVRATRIGLSRTVAQSLYVVPDAADEQP